MKLVFFGFKHRYRYKDLNNFLHSRFYGKYFLLNLGGPIKHIIAKILLKLNLGFTISCDARPLINDKKKGINFFIRGTNFNIPSNFRHLDNNFVSIKSPFQKDKNIFQIYPINIIKTKINHNLKIIFIGGGNINLNKKEKILWNKYKKLILNDFTILDKKSFWIKLLKKKDNEKISIIYKKFKLLLRFEIIKQLKKKYNERFILVGNDWENYSIKSLPSNFRKSYVKNLYKGNICLVFGSAEGSSSLYSRSNQIIESGGLILQSQQIDFKDIWKKLHNQILFKNLDDLKKLINKLITDLELSSRILVNIQKNFKNSRKLIEKNFKYIFKKTY